MTRAMIGGVVACAALTLAASAQAAVSCSVATTGVAFGTYTPTSLTDDNSTASIDVSCSGSLLQIVSYTVALSAGNGTFSSRKLVSGTNSLNYNLYIDPAYLVIWGDGTLGSQLASASFSLAVSPTVKSLIVYGKIPAGQTTVPVGTYVDSLLVTVSF